MKILQDFLISEKKSWKLPQFIVDKIPRDDKCLWNSQKKFLKVLSEKCLGGFLRNLLIKIKSLLNYSFRTPSFLFCLAFRWFLSCLFLVSDWFFDHFFFRLSRECSSSPAGIYVSHGNASGILLVISPATSSGLFSDILPSIPSGIRHQLFQQFL